MLMKRLLFPLFFTLTLTLSSCGDEEKTKRSNPPSPPTPTPAPSWTEAKAIIDANCALSGCHANGARGDFIDSGVKFKASKAKAKLTSGAMPPPGSAAAQRFSSADRNKLLAYLSSR